MLLVRKITPIQWFVILALICIGLALGLPPNQDSLHSLNISAGTYRMALVVLLVPYVIIWYAAFYAYSKLRQYDAAIKGTKQKDGQAFHKMMLGMGALAFGLVVPTIVSLVFNNIAQYHHAWTAVASNIGTYLSLAFALPAFVLIGRGARVLSNAVKGQIGLGQTQWAAGGFVVLGIMFSYLVTKGFYTGTNYHMSIYQLLLTVVAPYVFLWFIAILGVMDFSLYATRSKGLLYRRFLRQFAIGISVVVAGSIANEFAAATIAKSVSHSLTALLLTDYVLLIIIAAGLIIMAVATKNLKKIEEV